MRGSRDRRGRVALATTSLVALHAARGRGHRPLRGVPAPPRRLLLAACGVALTTAVAAPAPATPGQAHVDHTGAAAASLLQGLPLPDRATGALPGGARPVPAVVAVRPGDSLWSIAEATLPDHAPVAAVAEQSRRLHAANRHLIGPDPDLIRPGQRLRLPRP